MTIEVEITPQMATLLEQLLATGLWGRTTAEVAQRLLERGIQRQFRRPKLNLRPLPEQYHS